MKNNKGFTILETLIVVVMMTTSLLAVYSGYTTSINNEKKRIYYDDIVDIYKVDYMKNYLLEYSKFENYIENHFKDNDEIYMTLGTNYDIDVNSYLFSTGETQTRYFDLIEYYEIERLIIFKTDFKILSTCTNEVITSSYVTGGSYDTICRTMSFLGINMIDYLRSLGSNVSFKEDDYILIGSFKRAGEAKNTYAYSFLGGLND